MAFFARRFSDQLLEPRTQVRNSRRREDRNFIAPAFLQRAENYAKDYTGIFIGRDVGRTRVDHLVGSVEKFRHVQALNCAGYCSEIRKGRIAAAYAGQTEKDVAKAARLSDLLHVRAGIGDR